jgi:hypothetical protein
VKRLLLYILITAIPAAADRVGQGAGISENNIAFAYTYLESYLRLCQAMTDCLQTDDQKKVLAEILDGMKQERALNPNQIGFKSQAKDGIFLIDGKVRIAMTYADSGAPIYFNLDQLYTKDGNGDVQGLSIQTAVALLVHEYGHHHGITDHDWLDILGQRVGHAMSPRVYSGILNPDRANVGYSSVYFDGESQAMYTQTVVTDGPNMYDLTPSIKARFKCPNYNNTPAVLTGLGLFGFTFTYPYNPKPSLVAYAKPYCRVIKNGVAITFSPPGFGVRVQLALIWDNDKKTWLLNPASMNPEQVICATEPLMCRWGAANTKRARLPYFNETQTQQEIPYALPQY